MKSKSILIGVTGGIAAYKTPILVRRLRDQGADVRVVMTAGAGHFITALTLQAVSGHPVRDTLLDAQAESGMDHIDLARWADMVVIAPASADFIARLVHGMADDLLSTLCLATGAPIYIAPAMNQQMWQNPITRTNIALIKHHGIQVLGPAEGDQACGETGPGRMLEPTDIVEALLSLCASDPIDNTDRSDKPSILITAGPTWEALDPVRGLTNHSSGKMGYALAKAFTAAGYPVTLISGPTALDRPAGVEFIPVVSANDMLGAVHQHVSGVEIFISVAAVADYRPEQNSLKKIKKSNDTMQLTLVRNPDILASVAALDTPPFTVGFAAETDNVTGYAREKLEKKGIDMIIANQVGNGMVFGQDDNKVCVLSANETYNLGPDSKHKLAQQLVSTIQTQFESKT